MTDRELDELAAEIVAVESHYAPGEWAAVEAAADALIEEARAVGADPREHAAKIMEAMAADVDRGLPSDEDEYVARADNAMAAALVWVGRK